MIVASASLQGATVPSSKVVERVAQYNYTQIVRHSYQFTRTLTQSALYTSGEPAYESKKKAIEHKRALEAMFFFGARDLDTGGSEPQGFSGGLVEFLSTNLHDPSGAMTNTELDTFLQKDFQYGGQNKVLFVAPTIARVISTYLRDNWVRTGPDASLYGVKVDGLISGAYGYQIPVFVKREWAAPRAYGKVETFCRERGYPLTRFGSLRPWMLAMTLMILEMQRLGLRPTGGVDEFFDTKARQDGKAIEGLETVDEQIEFVTLLDRGMDDELVIQTVGELQQLSAKLSPFVNAWKTGDERGLEELLLKELKEYPRLYRILIVERNQRWLKRIEGCLTQPARVMVIVGAGHLTGLDGLLEALRKRGYKVAIASNLLEFQAQLDALKKEGFPLLEKKDLPLDIKASITLFHSLCEIGKGANPHMATQVKRIVEAMDQKRIDLQKIFTGEVKAQQVADKFA